MPFSIHLLLFSLACLLLTPAVSQTYSGKNLVFDKLDKSDGLTNDTDNNFIFKDSRGYLWVSSLQGVYQYDGYNFRFFTSNPNDKTGMIGSNVQSEFYEDEEKNIWFATYQGLNKYDVKEDKILGYTISDESGNALNNQYYIFHINTSSQILWMMVDFHIYKYDYKNKEVVSSIGPKMHSIRVSVKLDELGQVAKIYGAPWLYDSGFEILHNENTVWRYEKVNFEGSAEGAVISDFVFAKGFVWLISEDGLIKYSEENKNEGVFTQESKQKSQFITATLYGNDQILILSKTSGLCVFDLASEKFKLIPTQVKGLNNSSLRNILIDNDNILWVDIKGGGIGRADLKAGPLSDNPNKIYELKNISKVSSKGKICFLSRDNNFIILDTTKTHTVLFKEQLDIPMRDVLMTSEREVLFIDDHSLYSFNTNSRKLKEEAKVNFKLLGICEFQNQIFLTSFKGVCKWNKKNKSISALKYSNNRYNQEASLVDGIFMGDNSYLINYESKEFHIASIHGDSIEVMQSSPFNSFIYDAVFYDNKWYYVSVNGLFRIDQNANHKKLGYQSYLPELGFNSIVYCEDKFLLGGSDGLYAYSIKDSSLHQINNIFEENLSVIPQGIKHLTDGRILVASDKAVYKLDEKDLNYERKSPELKLQSIEINNRVNKSPTILDAKHSEIELSHNVDFFALELKSINPRLEMKGDVKYKDSRMNQWQTLSNGKLSFENLTPGNFELSFVALDKKLNASPIKKLKVIVKEPFYKSNGFILIAIFLLTLVSLGIGLVIGKVKSDRLQRQLLLQLAKEQERNRIASMIHDDMGATLSTIQIASEDLSMDIDDVNLKRKAVAIQNDAKDLVSRMRSNIWALQNETKSIKELCLELRQSAFDQIGPLNLQLTFPHVDSWPDSNLSGRTCMEVMLIQKESLNNIVKHAHAQHTSITTSIQDHQFVLQIKDDGRGLPDDLIPGMGISNMKKRANDINGKLEVKSTESGVTIKLTCPV